MMCVFNRVSVSICSYYEEELYDLNKKSSRSHSSINNHYELTHNQCLGFKIVAAVHFIFLCLDPVVCQCGRPGHIMLIWSLNVACVIRSQWMFHLSLQLFTQKGQGAWIWLDKSTRHSLLIIRISCIFCCMSLFIFFSLELSRTKKSIIFMHFKDQTILLLIKKTNYRLIKSENNC